MARPSIRNAFRALAASLVVAAGCNTTVQPVHQARPPAEPGQTKGAPRIAEAQADPDAPLPTCPEPAPPADRAPSKPTFLLQNGHERPIQRIAVSTDGSKLASGAQDGTVRVWDLRTGLLLTRFVTAGYFVQDLSISADGKRLAYYAPDGTPEGLMVQVVDLDKLKSPRTTVPLHGAFQLSPDGTWLAMATDKLTLFDAKTGRPKKEIAVGAKTPSALALTHDAEGRRVAAAYPGELVVVDVTTDSVTHRFPLASGLADTPMRVTLTPEVVVLVSAGGTITLFPLAKGGAPRVLPGRYKDASAASGRLWALDLMTGRASAFTLPDGQAVSLSTPDPPQGDLVAASRDGSTLVMARSHLGVGTSIEVRDVQTMRAVRTIEGLPRSIESVAARPDGSELATGAFNGDLTRWDLRTGKPRPGIAESEREQGRVIALSYAPNGEQLASTTGGFEVRVRETARGQTLRRWSLRSGAFVRFTEFLPTGEELLTVHVQTDRKIVSKKGPGGAPVIEEKHDVAVERWDLRGPLPPLPKSPFGEIARPQGRVVAKLASDPRFFALSTDGLHLVVAGGDTLASLRTDTGKLNWTLKLQTIPLGIAKRPDGGMDVDRSHAAFSPDGKTVVVSTRRLETNKGGVQHFVSVLMEIDAGTGRVRNVHKPETDGPVRWHKGAIVVGGLRPVLLDASSFAVRARLAVADNEISAITVAPKRDLFLLSGNGGATSLVSERGDVVMTLVSTPNGEWVSATPSGAYRSSIDGARSVAWMFSDPLEGFSFERFATRFERPDLVERSLGGEETPAPASLARPPRLRVEAKAPRGMIETTDNRLTLDVVATSPSRVDRVRVFVDGKPAVDRLVCATEGRVSLDVPLHAGRNRLSLVAYDAAGYASNPEQLDVVSTSPLAEKPSLHVLSIGVSRYPNMPPEQQLDFADDDARSVASSLARFAGPNRPFGRIVATTLLDDEVTVGRVDEALAGLAGMRPDDLAVVFFAGHGARLDESKMLFLTSQAAFTREAATQHGIGWDRIEKALRGARGRVLMMLDACHAGYVSTEVVAPNESLARELAAGDRAGVLVFSAARGSQFSYEVPPDGASGASRGLELAWEGKQPPKQKDLKGGHGLFTSALLEALDGEAPDRDRSGAIEVNELVDYVTERVRAASNGKQTPWVARREMFGEFMVAPAAR
ncbi:caspase family protein [Polyangium jinanense]|uniref:Caspase family protein n=1 Tax=Polyangium jinanense TaxID=2829994 RepID=A0A9X3X711_9BACT|nr:caspase family protein [Polyangium jinanense]MDC3955972.1 caspase family protein [Polyangium jinanense]MDC3985089.1 caspase family protein [Polyangium jinanense]